MEEKYNICYTHEGKEQVCLGEYPKEIAEKIAKQMEIDFPGYGEHYIKPIKDKK